MDDPTKAPTRTPYRDGKPLADIIPPDRRHLKAAALVVTSMIAGVVLWTLGGSLLELVRGDAIIATPVKPPTGYVDGRIGAVSLGGPTGTVLLPPSKRSVVNVWLQGCSDCMPAFQAMATLQDEGGFGPDITVINVAYGEADPVWARRYGVADHLVFDPGGAKIVKPLGIDTFTTLVVEPDGSIIHRDRPNNVGYVARVRGFFAPVDEVGIQTLGPNDVERVVATRRAALKRTCWERSGRNDAPRNASVTASLSIESDGRVSSSQVTGDDPVLARCVENETRGWLFPAARSHTQVTIPFRFVRE